MAKTKSKDLVALIKANPGCVATIDNDCWWLYREHPDAGPAEDSPNRHAWEKANELARDGEVAALGDGGYGCGNCYGGDILQALAIIVGMKIESV